METYQEWKKKQPVTKNHLDSWLKSMDELKKDLAALEKAAEKADKEKKIKKPEEPKDKEKDEEKPDEGEPDEDKKEEPKTSDKPPSFSDYKKQRELQDKPAEQPKEKLRNEK